MKIIQQRQHHWNGHILRHQSLLLELAEGRMKGRHKGGRRKMQMLQMLARDGHVALKLEAEDTWRWSHKTSCQKPAVLQNCRGMLTALVTNW